MQPPTLRQLRTFLAVVETGSVSAAAQSLNLTQPAASQQLRELERALGVRLLHRAAGRMLPTPAGEAVIEPARRIQGALDDTIAAVQAFRSGAVGRVRLGTGATACINLLPPVLAAVKQRMPGLEIAVATGNSNEIAHRVAVGELDIGLVTLPLQPNRALTATRLLNDPLLAVIPRAHAPDGDSISAARLAALPLILYEPGGSTRAIIDAWFRRAGPPPQPAMELDSIETIKVLVGGGLGASILPQLALGSPVRDAVVKPLRPALGRQLGIVLRREKVLDRGLRLVLDALRETAG
ncbi:MAG TPA: LysR family transcriptional regulator [Acetobacteraceae bacterium]|nr:LysR family transcriptional regulator [Acetobacteraceae bacterium]